MREVIECLIDVARASTQGGRHEAAVALAREVQRQGDRELGVLVRRVLRTVATMEYLARKAGLSCPIGSCDSAGRWYPGGDEEASCCSSIRLPSRRFPDSLFRHCLTMSHVAELYGVAVDEIRSEIKRISTPVFLPSSRSARARVMDVYNRCVNGQLEAAALVLQAEKSLDVKKAVVWVIRGVLANRDLCERLGDLGALEGALAEAIRAGGELGEEAIRAVEFLGEQGARRVVVDAIADFIQSSPDGPAKGEAVWAVCSICSGETATERLVRSLGHALRSSGSEFVRCASAYALGKVWEKTIQVEEAVWALIDALSDEMFEVRAKAAEALGMIQGEFGLWSEAVRALVYAARRDEDAWVRHEAVCALAELAPFGRWDGGLAAEATELIAHELLGDKSWWVRRLAADGIRAIDPVVARELVGKAVRGEVERCLGRLRENSWRERIKGAKGLMDLGWLAATVDGTIMELAQAACRDRSDAVRVAAARALDSILEQGGHKMESSEVIRRVAADVSAILEEVEKRVAVDMLAGEQPDGRIREFHSAMASIARKLI